MRSKPEHPAKQELRAKILEHRKAGKPMRECVKLALRFVQTKYRHTIKRNK